MARSKLHILLKVKQREDTDPRLGLLCTQHCLQGAVPTLPSALGTPSVHVYNKEESGFENARQQSIIKYHNTVTAHIP